jgi:hypothetical protein
VQSAHGLIAGALDALDCAIDSLLLPWLAAVASPIEALLARLHLSSYASDAASIASESPTLASLERYCDGIAGHQLRLLGGASIAEPIRRALAARVLTLFVRHACLLRPIDDAGRHRLAREAAQVSDVFMSMLMYELAYTFCLRNVGSFQIEATVGLLWHEPQRLGRVYAELRALRPFLFLAVPDLTSALDQHFGKLSAADERSSAGEVQLPSATEAQRQAKIVTLLRSLRASNILHALVARLPRECSMPHSHAQVEPNSLLPLYSAVRCEL